jgi:hypothetical protein
MKLISIPALAAFLTILGAFAQTQKPGAAPKSELRDVKATGCTFSGTVAGCLLLRTLDGKNTYNIFTGDPPPDTGIVIVIEGKPHQGATSCRQGTALDVTKWESTGEKCSR